MTLRLGAPVKRDVANDEHLIREQLARSVQLISGFKNLSMPANRVLSTIENNSCDSNTDLRTKAGMIQKGSAELYSLSDKLKNLEVKIGEFYNFCKSGNDINIRIKEGIEESCKKIVNIIDNANTVSFFSIDIVNDVEDEILRLKDISGVSGPDVLRALEEMLGFIAFMQEKISKEIVANNANVMRILIARENKSAAMSDTAISDLLQICRGGGVL